VLKRINNWSKQNSGFIAFLGLICALSSLVISLLVKISPSFVAPKVVGFIQQYKDIAVWIGLILLAYAFFVTRKQSQTMLDENDSANLSSWSFGDDEWTSDQDGLSVTRKSLSYGGIYKSGATWENYNFSFEFKIMDKCAGWIVRAKSKEHYVMIQCNPQKIRPHVFSLNQTPDRMPHFVLIKEVDHNQSLKDWNKVRTEVKGHSIKVWINETLVWSDSELLKDFPMGTVGFRCSHDEHALFRCIKVVKA
jgi:hypothetical protein